MLLQRWAFPPHIHNTHFSFQDNENRSRALICALHNEECEHFTRDLPPIHMWPLPLHRIVCSHFHHLIVIFRRLSYCRFIILHFVSPNSIRSVPFFRRWDILVSKMEAFEYLIANVKNSMYFPSLNHWIGTSTLFPFAINWCFQMEQYEIRFYLA